MAVLNAFLSSGPWRMARRFPALHRLAQLGAMRRAITTRRQLARLDDRALKDIGLSRADALAEAGRTPWDLAIRQPGRRD